MIKKMNVGEFEGIKTPFSAFGRQINTGKYIIGIFIGLSAKFPFILYKSSKKPWIRNLYLISLLWIPLNAIYYLMVGLLAFSMSQFLFLWDSFKSINRYGEDRMVIISFIFTILIYLIGIYSIIYFIVIVI